METWFSLLSPWSNTTRHRVGVVVKPLTPLAVVQLTAAHLMVHGFPRRPVRQWVLSVPKRQRCFMQRDGAVLGMVLRIFLRVIAQSRQGHGAGVAQVRTTDGKCFKLAQQRRTVKFGC
jgi:hypothetical protein